MTISSSCSSCSTQNTLQQIFKKADTDGNGALSKSEFEAAAKNRPEGLPGLGGSNDPFSKLDADGDGQLTEAEAKKGFEDLRGDILKLLLQNQSLSQSYNYQSSAFDLLSSTDQDK